MSIDWISTAVLSAVVLSFVNVVDSHIISKRLPSFRAYLLPAGMVIFAWSLALAYLFPFSEDVATGPLLAAIVSGIIRAAAIVIMLYTMRGEEVSRIVPIVNTYPIFVAMMAVPLLGEVLDYRQWLAIIIVVAGVAMVSVRRGQGSGSTSTGKLLVLLIGASLMMAASNVAAKYALGSFSAWQMYWITHFILSGVFLAIALRPQVLRELNNCRQRNSSLVIIFMNEIIAVTALVLFYLAMQRGPVSLVSAIFSSRPLFVFLFALIISRFSPLLLEWHTEKAMLALRFLAVLMIVGGVVLIYLS